MDFGLLPFLIALEENDLVAIAEGGERIVYTHKHYPEFVFKRQKPVAQRRLKSFDLKSFLLKHLNNFDTYIVRQEYRAFVKFMLNYRGHPNDVPVARLFGFAFCEKGVLQVCEKIGNSEGEFCPTLISLLKDGLLTNEMLVALNKFAENLINSGIPTNDVNVSNIVLGTDVTQGYFFKLVDGFGDIHVLPIRTYFHAVRRRHLIELFSNYEKYGLIFDPATTTFSLP